jgi:hypothetical protein
MRVETLEQWEQAQAQIEDFARLAHNVKIAAEALATAFRGLADYPYMIEDAMPELSHFAREVAFQAYEWASLSNADFDPASRPSKRR